MRNTPLKLQVLDVLKKANRPLSVPNILEILAANNLDAHKTTLYRLLSKLRAQDLVQEVLLDSNISYYEINDKQHHHHFSCVVCKETNCVEDYELENRIHKLEQALLQKGMEVDEHQFSFTGRCRVCKVL